MSQHITPHNPSADRLRLAPDGTIIHAPAFFLTPLESQLGDSIFRLFDPLRPSRLNFLRLEARSQDLLEYHLIAESPLADPVYFRYWHIEDTDDNHSVFGIIDDTSVHRFEEWRFQQLKEFLITDVQEIVLSEFRNTVTTLSVLTDALTDHPEDLPDLTGRLQSVSQHLTHIITELHDAFRIDEQSRSTELPVSISDVIKTIKSWSVDRCVIHVFMNSDSATKIISDGFVRHVLRPVVLNAVEVSIPFQGDVHIHISLSPPPFHLVVFTVQDSGKGMSLHILSRAEDPFFTTKPGHSGLGLASARQYTEAHEAKLSLRSSEQGTTVTIGIPIVSPEPPPSEA